MLPIHANVVSAAFSVVFSFLIETPGSTWSPTQLKALSPILTLYDIPPVAGNAWWYRTCYDLL